MEKEIAVGQMGPEGMYDVDFVDGKIVLKAKYEGKGGEAELSAGFDLIYVLEKAKEKIDNKIVSGLIDMLIGVLKA